MPACSGGRPGGHAEGGGAGEEPEREGHRAERLDAHDVDLVAEGFDVAVRIARLKDSSLVARRLATDRLAVVGSPAYDGAEVGVYAVHAHRRHVPPKVRAFVDFLATRVARPPWLASQFIGTLGRRASAEPEERLQAPASLAAWLRRAGLPVPARIGDADVAWARTVREALFQLGVQALEGRTFDRAMLAKLNDAARGRTRGVLQLDKRGSSVWRSDDALRCAVGAIAEDAILRFTHDRDRLARCELPGCGALLLSRSRSDPRRWCSMEACGNRAKAAAFRARQRGRGR